MKIRPVIQRKVQSIPDASPCHKLAKIALAGWIISFGCIPLQILAQAPTQIKTNITTQIPAQTTPQPGIRLYGILQSGLRYTNNTARGRSIGVPNGTSRFGLQGEEILSSGYSAIFRLENGFASSTGTASQGRRLFGRQAYVGLRNHTLGELTFGRQYDFVGNWLGRPSATYRWIGNFSHPGDNDNFNYQFRLNNAVKYQTARMAGFQMGVLYSFGEGTEASHQNAFSMGLAYEDGPLKLQTAVLHVSNPAQAVSDGNWNTRNFSAISPRSPWNSGPVVPQSMVVYGAGGTYKMDDLTLGAVWSHSVYRRVNAPTEGLTVADFTFNNFELNAAYDLAAGFELAGSYTYTKAKIEPTNYAPDYHQINLIFNQSLSRRTILYYAAIYQRVEKSAVRQKSLIFGIFHRF